jgi:hypothetical protein
MSSYLDQLCFPPSAPAESELTHEVCSLLDERKRIYEARVETIRSMPAIWSLGMRAMTGMVCLYMAAVFLATASSYQIISTPVGSSAATLMGLCMVAVFALFLFGAALYGLGAWSRDSAMDILGIYAPLPSPSDRSTLLMANAKYLADLEYVHSIIGWTRLAWPTVTEQRVREAMVFMRQAPLGGDVLDKQPLAKQAELVSKNLVFVTNPRYVNRFMPWVSEK